MFRIFEITESLEPPYAIVCNDGKCTDSYMENFFLSSWDDDITKYAMLYENVKDLAMDVQMLQNVLPSTDLGIQTQGANGNWYLYDYNNQVKYIQELVNLK